MDDDEPLDALDEAVIGLAATYDEALRLPPLDAPAPLYPIEEQV